jgi:hypothetical protein
MIKARIQMDNAKYIINKDFDTELEMFEYALQQSNPFITTYNGLDKQGNSTYTIGFQSKVGVKDFKCSVSLTKAHKSTTTTTLDNKHFEHHDMLVAASNCWHNHQEPTTTYRVIHADLDDEEPTTTA